MASRCAYCGQVYEGLGIASTQGVYCSHKCSEEAVGLNKDDDPFADVLRTYRSFHEVLPRPRKRVESRVIPELPK